MDRDWFEAIVNKAIVSIPKEFLDRLANVSVVVEDMPSFYQADKLQQRKKERLLLGLYEGIPQTKRGGYGIGGQLPDKITIFRIPILAIARSEEEVEKVVRNTVIHEIAHHFGMNESRVRRAEARRLNLK